MTRKKIITTKQQIANYWRAKNEIPDSELNFKWEDAEKCCWNCGTPTSYLYRCHMIPDMLGGIDTPSNYVLLCAECDEHAPNINDKAAMWDWIKSNKMPVVVKGSYKIQNALAMFKQRNGYNFFDKAIYIPNFNDIIIKEFDTIGMHGGRITTSSYVYMFESIVKKYTLSEIPNISFYETFLSNLSQLNKRIFAGKVIDGLIKARANGHIGGRPTISQEKKDEIIVLKKKGWSLRRIAKQVGIHHGTVATYLKSMEPNNSIH